MSVHSRSFDFHCHVDLLPDPEAFINACERQLVLTIAVTTTPQAWAQNRKWMLRTRYVVPSLGLHPALVGDRYAEIALLETLLPEASFVGEIGLDGSQDFRPSMPKQREVFVRALVAAERLGGRVVSIHSRKAAKDVLRCLAENTTTRRVLPILHWFSDTASVARQAVDQGCYFSINHRMLRGKSAAVILQDLPIDRILTETDAPFTTDGSAMHEPQLIAGTVKQLAELRSLSLEEMTAVIAQNSARVLAFAGVSQPN